VAIHAMKFATVSGGNASRGGLGSWVPDRCSADHVPQWVAIAPGYTTHARTPCGLASAPSAWVKPVSANFAAQ
jgi:hypothetical protein